MLFRSRRAGAIRVQAFNQTFAAAEALAAGRLPSGVPGNRLAILTNGGGMAVLAADALAARKGTLAELSPGTIAALDGMLPRNWSRGNPVDVIGDASPERLARATAIVAADPGVDAVLLIHCPTAVCPAQSAARAVIDALAVAPGKPITLAPGGTHIMLMGLHQGLAEGSAFPLVLHFEQTCDVSLSVEIGRAHV